MKKQSPETGAEFVERWQRDTERLAGEGLYYPEEEHASCGVGMVAAVDGIPTRRVVEAAIEALKKIWHRGAVDADGKTGDGAGISLRTSLYSNGYWQRRCTGRMRNAHSETGVESPRSTIRWRRIPSSASPTIREMHFLLTQRPCVQNLHFFSRIASAWVKLAQYLRRTTT